MQTITTIGLDIAKSINAGTGWASQSQIAWCRIKTPARQRAELVELVEARPDPAVQRSCVGGGSICAIAATLNDQREAVQLAKLQSLNFGEPTAKCPTGPRSRPDTGLGRARPRISSSAMPDECGAVPAASLFPSSLRKILA